MTRDSYERYQELLDKRTLTRDERDELDFLDAEEEAYERLRDAWEWESERVREWNRREGM